MRGKFKNILQIVLLSFCGRFYFQCIKAQARSRSKQIVFQPVPSSLSKPVPNPLVDFGMDSKIQEESAAKAHTKVIDEEFGEVLYKLSDTTIGSIVQKNLHVTDPDPDMGP